MACLSTQNRQASLRDLLGGTLRELRGAMRELALYVCAVTALSLLPIADFAFGWVISLGVIAGYFVAQYWLYQVMLRRAGLLVDSGRRIASFAFMAAILIWPIAFGINVLVIGGIVLVARWIMAPAFLVARPINLFEAIGASWRASDGNTLALSLAFSAVFVIWLTAFGLLGSLWNFDSWGAQTPPPFWVLMNILPLLLMGLSVTAFRQLSDDGETLGEVFA